MAKETLSQRDKNTMVQNFQAFMQSEDAARLVGQSTLKKLVKAINEDLRVDATLHAAVIQAVGPVIFKAIQRCYGNNRKTVKPVDL